MSALEDFRNNEEVQLEGASERLEFYKESHKANRYAACGSNTSVINRPTLICKDTDAKIALDFNIRSHCVAEMRQLFHLLDRDSEGFLRRKKLESLFEIQNEETAEPASTIGPVIQFREFIRILQIRSNGRNNSARLVDGDSSIIRRQQMDRRAISIMFESHWTIFNTCKLQTAGGKCA
eukprot:scaffold814_cov248-Chaetoceros_neogracile.AAC.2